MYILTLSDSDKRGAIIRFSSFSTIENAVQSWKDRKDISPHHLPCYKHGWRLFRSTVNEEMNIDISEHLI